MAENAKSNYYDRIKIEPSFQQKFPEGRDKLLALAESSRSKPLPSSNSSSTSSSKETPSKPPKMGLKDLRRAAANSSSVDQQHGQPTTKIRPVPVYASEQSLPEKVSQALKGLAIRPVSLRHNGGVVTADDVVYYSSGSNNSSYDGGGGAGRKNNAGLISENNNGTQKNAPTNLRRSLSKSSEKLNNNSGSNSATTNGDVVAAIESRFLPTSKNHQAPSAPVGSSGGGATHYSKVKQYSYGVNLEDLRKMYKSMPNCSADDEYCDDTSSVHHSVRQTNILNAVRDSLSDDSTYANIEELRQISSSMNRSSDDSMMMMLQQHNNHNNRTKTNNNNSNLCCNKTTTTTTTGGVSVLRNSCGSPTDSGYRSVPRELDFDNVVVNSTTPTPDPLYANMKSFETITTNNNTSNNSNSNNNNSNKCSVLVDSAPAAAPLDSLPKNKTSRTAADETSTSCPSPYSDLSSPSYNSSTHSSASRENRGAGAVGGGPGQNDQQRLPSNDIGRQQPKISTAAAVAVGSFDTINTNVSLPDEFSLDRCPKLVELDRVPWNEKDVVTVLQKGRTKSFVNQIAIDIVPRLTYLLQRPLIRLAKEIQRLCVRFNKCTKHEIQCATKIILPCIVGESCIKAAVQATAMYMMSGDVLKQSKSHRAGLRFSVGKFHRWLCDAQVSLCVHDWASVFLTAVMENLLEEIVLQSIANQHTPDDMLTSESLDLSLANNVELWGLLQPYAHLICSRTANGVLGLPNSAVIIGPLLKHGAYGSKSHEKMKANGTLVKNFEQCLLATCAGSLTELTELVHRVVSQNGGKSGSSGCIPTVVAGSSAPNAKPQPMWSKDALQTLFYFMRCSQLEHADSSNLSHPFLILAHERPYLVLPPLVEWLRVSQAHCEHRQGSVIDSDDILQAARVLLPGLDCPTRPFSIDDPLHNNCRLNSQTWSLRLKQDLALRMLSCGRSDLVPQAVQMLGSQNLNNFNEQGLTPLMLSALFGDESAVHVLLDAGADVNVTVPANVNCQTCPNLIVELAGWSALNFAVVGKHVTLVQQLLNRNASVELPTMCTETPLQLAAMMGHCDLVNLLVAKGADPYYSTAKCDSGFKQRGCPSAIALAAAHGHRNIVQLLLARRKGRSEEVLSLEDFLAEGTSPPNGPTDGSSTSNVAGSSWLLKLSKNQQKTLQEAMYHAAESGFVDITMDLRNIGIPWNTHVWTQTLAAAQELRRKALVQLLLTDFVKYRLEDLNQEFVDDCLPLLFEIFRRSKNEITSTQISKILNQLYGKEAVPSIAPPETSSAPRIDAKYVNNPDLSDVKFVVEGRLFYAHKIVLVNSSQQFERMLQDLTTNGDKIEIKDVRYDVFQLVMEFLYNGKLNEHVLDLPILLQLLSASRQFELKHLQLTCESLIAKRLDVESCLEIYRFATTIEATNLTRFCEGFFLQNLLAIMNKVDGFRKLLYSSLKSDDNRGTDLVSGLLSTLTHRLEQRINAKK